MVKTFITTVKLYTFITWKSTFSSFPSFTWKRPAVQLCWTKLPNIVASIALPSRAWQTVCSQVKLGNKMKNPWT